MSNIKIKTISKNQDNSKTYEIFFNNKSIGKFCLLDRPKVKQINKNIFLISNKSITIVYNKLKKSQINFYFVNNERKSIFVLKEYLFTIGKNLTRVVNLRTMKDSFYVYRIQDYIFFYDNKTIKVLNLKTRKIKNTKITDLPSNILKIGKIIYVFIREYLNNTDTVIGYDYNTLKKIIEHNADSTFIAKNKLFILKSKTELIQITNKSVKKIEINTSILDKEYSVIKKYLYKDLNKLDKHIYFCDCSDYTRRFRLVIDLKNKKMYTESSILLNSLFNDIYVKIDTKSKSIQISQKKFQFSEKLRFPKVHYIMKGVLVLVSNRPYKNGLMRDFYILNLESEKIIKIQDFTVCRPCFSNNDDVSDIILYKKENTDKWICIIKYNNNKVSVKEDILDFSIRRNILKLKFSDHISEIKEVYNFNRFFK